MSPKPFLTAEWRYLVMLNFEAPEELLQPWVPKGTVLDTYRGKVYVSCVGFRFLKTQLKGVPIPGHQNFDEFNLRFYVRRFDGENWRRGVVFLKEVVPKLAIAWTARLFYNEPYTALPMRHQLRVEGTPPAVRYEWRLNGEWNFVEAEAEAETPAQIPKPGSLEEFIVEHYWGYTPQKDGSVLEYHVEHPPWKVWRCSRFNLQWDAVALYGDWAHSIFHQTPASAFIAEGSPVTVFEGVPLK